MIVYIYGLVDPRTSEIRYVGKAISPTHRLAEHLNGQSNDAVAAWIAELAAEGRAPALVVLREVDGLVADAAERDEIATRFFAGCPLLNINSVPPDMPGARAAASERRRLYKESGPVRSWGAHALLNAATVITRAQIGAAIGVSQAAISYILKGQNEPSIKSAILFRDVLGIEIDWWAKPAPIADERAA